MSELYSTTDVRKNSFVLASIILLGISAFIALLYFAKGVLAPLTLGAVLALAMLPLSNWMEKKGFPRSLSSFISILLLTLFIAGIATLISFQVANISNDLSSITENLKPKFEKLSSWLSSNLGINLDDQLTNLKDNLKSSIGNLAKSGFTYAGGFLGALGTFILILVYAFFFLNARRHYARFFYKAAGETNRANVTQILTGSVDIVKKYMLARLLLIVILAGFYSLGFWLAGLPYFLLLASVAAVLSILPIFGNIIAGGIVALAGFVTTGEISVVLWSLAVMAAAQFIESYGLTPLIIGKEVDLNPVFSIATVIIGGAIWGFEGFLLALPLFGILKLILEQSEKTRPYSFLLNNN